MLCCVCWGRSALALWTDAAPTETARSRGRDREGKDLRREVDGGLGKEVDRHGRVEHGGEGFRREVDGGLRREVDGHGRV